MRKSRARLAASSARAAADVPALQKRPLGRFATGETIGFRFREGADPMTQHALDFDADLGIIGPAIETFFRDRFWWHDTKFTMEDLRSYIAAVAGPVAPSTVERTMRLLQKHGRINYDQLDDCGFRYRAKGIRRD